MISSYTVNSNNRYGDGVHHPSFPNLWRVAKVEGDAIAVQLQTVKPQDPDDSQAAQTALRINNTLNDGTANVDINNINTTISTSNEDETEEDRNDTKDNDSICIDQLRKHAAYKEGTLLLEGQVVTGTAYGQAWIQTRSSSGFHYLPRSMVRPFWPTYSVVGSTHHATGRSGVQKRGVAPYVWKNNLSSSSSNLAYVNTNKELVDNIDTTEATTKDGTATTTTMSEFFSSDNHKEYDPSSPLREAELIKSIGHVFEQEEIPVPGIDPLSCNWWTADGRVWWPKTVPLQFEAWGVPLLPQQPTTAACCGIVAIAFPPPKAVTAQAANMSPAYIKFAFQGRAAWLVAIILTEYLMITLGGLAGVEYGWGITLQFIYALALLFLVLFEILVIAVLVPNGHLWLKINLLKMPIAVGKSVLWRWDLYGDVGFAILAFQQRDRITPPLWVISTIVVTIVIGGRLLYSFYYVKKLVKCVDEKNLAKVSVPAFMTVFQLLCQSIHSSEGTEARRLTARTELGFEGLRTLCEDIPGIAIQAAYLFGDDRPPICTGCGYGFVFTSLIVSICTSIPGIFRLITAYQKYMNVTSELSDKQTSVTAERSPDRQMHRKILEV